MKILVPLRDKSFISRFSNAGADEYYVGFHDDRWHQCFGKYADINRMSGFGRRANPFSFSELLDVIKQIKDQGKSVFVTLNANGYSKKQIDYIELNYFPQLLKSEIDGLILSDVNIINSAVKFGIKPIASTMCAVYNSDIARSYLKLGVNRMIFPRDLSLDELESMCKKNPDIQFEAFFMRNGCIFSDGYCLGLHTFDCNAICTYTRSINTIYDCDYINFRDIHNLDINNYIYRTSYHLNACAMCAVFKLQKMGINSLKIVGRADDSESICKDIHLTKQNCDLATTCDNEKEYLLNMVFPDGYPEMCRMGLSCYYPEIRFGK